MSEPITIIIPALPSDYAKPYPELLSTLCSMEMTFRGEHCGIHRIPQKLWRL